MNRRFGTAPDHGTAETTRLAVWLALVTFLIVLQYASPKPSANVLYQWSTVGAGVIQAAIVIGLMAAIAVGRPGLLALRVPGSLRQAGLYVAGVLVAIYIFEPVYAGLTHPGNEQGLVPSHWEPAHAAAYVANGVVICTLVPLSEEIMFRGLGYSLLEPFGRWPAILGVGLLFGLSHGLVLLLPVIVFFGCLLAWVRSRTDSVFPGMVAHGVFNLIALVAAVTIGS
ncbi:MAG: CPBP family glutamic-type intramembrane protease [Gaiellaceae bacterium]